MTAPTPPTIENILGLIANLRGESGCPWDRQQTPETVSIYLIEEVYELVDAIVAGNRDAIFEELGDVLFQILFIAALYIEKGELDLGSVIQHNIAKMERRHPHVFGSETITDAENVKHRWNQIKQAEKPNGREASILDSIPSGMPALMRAYRVSERAAQSGFDWNDFKGVMHKAGEECEEFYAEMKKVGDDISEPGKAALEFGDILFTLVNVARFARIHPEKALLGAIQKFEYRFRHMEQAALEEGVSLERVPRDKKEVLWQLAKKRCNGIRRDTG